LQISFIKDDYFCYFSKKKVKNVRFYENAYCVNRMLTILTILLALAAVKNTTAYK